MAADPDLDLETLRMAESFFSSVWYRIADLRPRLVPRAEVSRHRFRGHGWYVVHDPATGRVHRFTPAAWMLIGHMTGRQTIAQLWTRAVEALGEDAMSQDEVVRLLAQLHGADLIQVDVPPDTDALLKRYHQQRRQKRRQATLNPMSIRIPLWNPDRFLTRTLPYARLAFGPVGAVVWVLTVLAGLVAAGLSWPELSNGMIDRVLTAQNLLVLWLVYPVVKALHELGHGYAAKLRGVEVHETGIMLLLLFPVPYVDASASAALPDKHQRALIGAAGILVELFLAAVAMILWMVLEPGLGRTIMFNVLLIGGISTLFVNGNPLLRFDGYYVLSDLIEIPNLGQRSNRLWGGLVERHLFRAPREPLPGADWGERAWMLAYAPAAYVYRIVLSLSIAMIVATKAFGLGIVLGLWGLFMSIVLPLLRSLHHVVAGPRLASVRKRAVTLTTTGIAALLVFVLAVPLPVTTMAEGVVWLPERSEVRAGTDGFARDFIAAPASRVDRGTPLLQAEDPVVDTRIDLARARVAQAEREYRAAFATDRARAEILRNQLTEEQAQLRREEDEKARLLIRAPASGLFVVPRADDLPGRFMQRGELLGHIIEPELRTVRVAVAQDAVDLVRQNLRGVEVLLLSRSGESFSADVIREVPAAARTLPNAAFTTQGGGRIPADPGDPEGLTSFGGYFQFDLALDRDLPRGVFGSHALIRFSHDWQPLGRQIYRAVRIVLLRQLDV